MFIKPIDLSEKMRPAFNRARSVCGFVKEQAGLGHNLFMLDQVKIYDEKTLSICRHIVNDFCVLIHLRTYGSVMELFRDG